MTLTQPPERIVPPVEVLTRPQKLRKWFVELLFPNGEKHRQELKQESDRRHSYAQEAQARRLRLDIYEQRLNTVITKAGLNGKH